MWSEAKAKTVKGAKEKITGCDRAPKGVRCEYWRHLARSTDDMCCVYILIKKRSTGGKTPCKCYEAYKTPRLLPTDPDVIFADKYYRVWEEKEIKNYIQNTYENL